MLRGLKYLHSAGIIHRDLKPANVLVNLDNDLRIADFGLSRPSGDNMTGYVVTRWYRSPEVMFNWCNYDSAVDIWSVGCIMAELILGRPLIKGSDHISQLLETFAILGTPSEALLSKLTSQDAINFLRSQPKQTAKDLSKILGDFQDADGLDLLRKMLDIDPTNRITAEEGLKHPYMEPFADADDEPICERMFSDKHANQTNYKTDQWRDLVYGSIKRFQPK